MPVTDTNTKFLGQLDRLVLLVCVLFVLFIPVDKRIWYDETVSVLCSKGISHSTPAAFEGVSLITNAELGSYNTPSKVFDATVIDNSNSYLYNITLHYFTNLFGNTVNTYVLLSRLFSVLSLVSFFFLSRRFIASPIFRSVALLLLLADPVFFGMSMEIRAYAAGIFFTCLSALYLTRFIDGEDSPGNLFFTFLFSVAAFLTHFLAVYVLLVYGLLLIILKGKKLLSKKYILPVLIPVLLLGLFFAFALSGLMVMNKQNEGIAEMHKGEFTYASVFFNFVRFTAINMKVVLPAFHPSDIIKLLSLVVVILVCTLARKLANDKIHRRHTYMLLLLAISGSLMLTALSLIAKHNTPFYNRYFSFAIPFNCLFIAYFLYLLFKKSRFAIVNYTTLLFFIVPVTLLFYKGLGTKGNVKYTHTDIADIIVADKMTDVVVKESADALLIHCFLPQGYKLNYHVDPTATSFNAYNSTTTRALPIIRIDN